jgi:hypothetical protein
MHGDICEGQMILTLFIAVMVAIQHVSNVDFMSACRFHPGLSAIYRLCSSMNLLAAQVSAALVGGTAQTGGWVQEQFEPLANAGYQAGLAFPPRPFLRF